MIIKEERLAIVETTVKHLPPERPRVASGMGLPADVLDQVTSIPYTSIHTYCTPHLALLLYSPTQYTTLRLISYTHCPHYSGWARG